MVTSRETATKYEELAGRYENRAMGLEGLRKKPIHQGQPTSYFERIEALHKKISSLYENAAEEWKKTGKTNQALEDYRKSAEYAWSPGDRDRLTQIVEKLSQPNRPRSLFPVLSSVFLLSSLFFISFSLTGNAIADLSKENLTLTGTGLFILGLVFAFFYIQEKKR
jgi:hypothetical protein